MRLPRMAVVVLLAAVGCCSACTSPVHPAVPPTARPGAPRPCSTAIAPFRGCAACRCPSGRRRDHHPAWRRRTAPGLSSGSTRPKSVGVFRERGARAPSLARRVSLPRQLPFGEALADGGRYLLVTNFDAGAVAVISTRRAENGARHPVLGTLTDPAGTGAIEVTLPPGERFAFVSMDDSGEIAVFNLRRALTAGFVRADLAGNIPMGTLPVGLSVAPDGRWLYGTSELGPGSRS